MTIVTVILVTMRTYEISLPSTSHPNAQDLAKPKNVVGLGRYTPIPVVDIPDIQINILPAREPSLDVLVPSPDDPVPSPEYILDQDISADEDTGSE